MKNRDKQGEDSEKEGKIKEKASKDREKTSRTQEQCSCKGTAGPGTYSGWEEGGALGGGGRG